MAGEDPGWKGHPYWLGLLLHTDPEGMLGTSPWWQGREKQAGLCQGSALGAIGGLGPGWQCTSKTRVASGSLEEKAGQKRSSGALKGPRDGREALVDRKPASSGANG